MNSTKPEDTDLYKLWRLASRRGYSLRLEGDYIRLVPLRTPGDNGQARTFPNSADGIKSARAWLETPGIPIKAKAPL